MNVDLDINNYSYEDILNLFNLESDFDINALKKAKKIVLQTHPDKCKLPKEYFLFYSKAYKMIYQIYEFRSKTNRSLDEDYNNLIKESDESNKVAIKDMNKKESFHNWFNRLFEKYYDKDNDGHGDWLSGDSTNDNPEINNTMQMNDFINDKKKILSENQSLVKQNFEQYIPCSGENIYSEKKEVFTNENIFSKFQYEDVKKAHNETLIPVSEDILLTKEKYNSINDIKYKRSSEKFNVLSKEESNQILINKDLNETNISSQQAFSLLKEQELNIEKNKLFWGELKMLQNKK